MAGEVFSAVFRGISQFNSTAKDIQGRVDKATLSALRANQNKLKAAVRANLKGEPRWTERGASTITGKTFQVEGTTGQTNSPRAGSPGRMSGVLYKGVGGVKRPKRDILGNYVGGVGIGALPNNVKKRPLEAKYPYFKPAVDKVEPLMGKTFEKGWDKAIKREGGIL